SNEVLERYRGAGSGVDFEVSRDRHHVPGPCRGGIRPGRGAGGDPGRRANGRVEALARTGGEGRGQGRRGRELAGLVFAGDARRVDLGSDSEGDAAAET